MKRGKEMETKIEETQMKPCPFCGAPAVRLAMLDMDSLDSICNRLAGGWLEFAPDTGETVIGDAVELTKGEICATSYKASFDSDRWLGR